MRAIPYKGDLLDFRFSKRKNMEHKQASKDENEVGIHLSCNNVFLSLSLGFYLKGHLSTLDKADFIITDRPELESSYTQLPICLIGRDLNLPCSVYEMFNGLHDFYSRVNAKQALVFQQDLRHLNQNEKKQRAQARISTKTQRSPYLSEGVDRESLLIESIKREKMQELIKNTNPALGAQIELLFNELSQKIYETLSAKKVKP